MAACLPCSGPATMNPCYSIAASTQCISVRYMPRSYIPKISTSVGLGSRGTFNILARPLLHDRQVAFTCHSLPSGQELQRGHHKQDPNVRGKVQAASSAPGAQPVEPSGVVVQTQQGQRSTSLTSEPLSLLDVDKELWEVLDMCTDEELEAVYNILHSSSPFSPVIKSLVMEREPAMVELRGRVSVMHKVESRFRFLAADPACLLQGKRPDYRSTLLSIRDRIDVHCSSNLDTFDLETEIFLHIMKNCLEYVQGEHDPDPREAAAVAYATEGDGMGGSTFARKPNWTERLTAPFRFGIKEFVPTLVKLGSIATVNAVGRSTMQQLGTQLVSSHLRYQAAVKAATGAAKGAMSNWGKQAVLEAAQKGLTSTAARYGAVQGALAFLGPLMWGWLALDLALKSIGTDYARVIRAVFLLAQVRLLRTQGFVTPSSEDDKDEYEDPGAAFM